MMVGDQSELLCHQRVSNLPSDPTAQMYAKRHNLAFMNVTWEDNSRTKGSCWGPCISDMTLKANGRRLPVLRQPNFTDLTWDISMESIPVVVGNEFGGGGVLRPVSLREYLQNFGMYCPGAASHTSLLAPSRDSHVIVSSQACFLPVVQGRETTFNVSLFNYQSRPKSPAVLAIVATSKGTSAQVVESSDQDLFFNSNGQKTRFVGQRLKDNRRERGVVLHGAMTQEEKQDNVVVIIQVPLKRQEAPATTTPFGFSSPPAFGAPGCATGSLFGGATPQPFGGAQSSGVINFSGGGMPLQQQQQQCQESESFFGGSPFGLFGAASRARCDVEEAIVKVGKSEGSFSALNGLQVERDPRFPVRVTMQFYKSTSNGVLSQPVVDGIATQLAHSRSKADFIGSLVCGGMSWRPTETHPSPAFSFPPRPPVTPEAPRQPFPPFQPHQQPQPPHPGVTCDKCSTDLALKPGPRFKCLQCPDFDLCTPCESTLATDSFHNPTHVFAKIRDSRTQAHSSIALSNRSGFVHEGVGCSRCGVSFMVGVRYACMVCKGLNYCEACESSASHSLATRHNMVRVVDSGSLHESVVWQMPGLLQ